MKWQNAERATYASIRFQDGGGFAVGPVEMDRAGRVLFRVLVPNGNGMCSHTRVILEGASAETMRKVFIAGLASDQEATIGEAETLDDALAMSVAAYGQA